MPLKPRVDILIDMSPVVNIAAYQFVPLTDLPALRERLLGKCKAWRLKGTILISLEGINVFVAGGRRAAQFASAAG